jgi:tetratricopeptide (TPR) repeat protein
MADRYGYQPYIGIFIMVAWGASELAERYRISVRWLAAAGAIVLVALTIDTSRQIGYWKDNLLLWEHGAATVPNHWCAEINVGMRLWERGQHAEAMKHLYTGSAIHPDEAYSGMLIGYEQQQQGHLGEAISRYRHALNDYNLSDSDRAHIYRNLAVVYRDLGDMKDANDSYARALALQPK